MIIILVQIIDESDERAIIVPAIIACLNYYLPCDIVTMYTED